MTLRGVREGILGNGNLESSLEGFRIVNDLLAVFANAGQIGLDRVSSHGPGLSNGLSVRDTSREGRNDNRITAFRFRPQENSIG